MSSYYSKQARATELDDYLELARAGPSLSDEQHIFNKLIFDAVNECINECIVDVSPRPSGLCVANILRSFELALPSIVRMASPSFSLFMFV